MEKLRIVTKGFRAGDRSRGRFATPADFPLHDGTPYRDYAYDVGVWDLSIIQGPFSVLPCQTLVTIRNCFVAVPPSAPAYLALDGGDVQRGAALQVARVDVGAQLHQQLQHVALPLGRRAVQRRQPVGRPPLHAPTHPNPPRG
jgi:hypothetical protein